MLDILGVRLLNKEQGRVGLRPVQVEFRISGADFDNLPFKDLQGLFDQGVILEILLAR